MTDLPKLALSIRQPWAWAIMNAGKDVENRSWATKRRGPICIHAASTLTSDEIEDFNITLRGISQLCPEYLPARCEYPLQDQLYRRRIIGTAEIVDCVEASESPWFFGRYGFVLRNVQAVAFIPVKGTLGFFDWRNNLVVA